MTYFPGLEQLIAERDRLRAFVLTVVSNGPGNLAWGIDDAALAAVAIPPVASAWTNALSATATEGDWFWWRDPAQPDVLHIDRVGTDPTGKVEVRWFGPIGLLTECQRVRFADDALQALTAADRRLGQTA